MEGASFYAFAAEGCRVCRLNKENGVFAQIYKKRLTKRWVSSYTRKNFSVLNR